MLGEFVKGHMAHLPTGKKCSFLDGQLWLKILHINCATTIMAWHTPKQIHRCADFIETFRYLIWHHVREKMCGSKVRGTQGHTVGTLSKLVTSIVTKCKVICVLFLNLSLFSGTPWCRRSFTECSTCGGPLVPIGSHMHCRFSFCHQNLHKQMK